MAIVHFERFPGLDASHDEGSAARSRHLELGPSVSYSLAGNGPSRRNVCLCLQRLRGADYGYLDRDEYCGRTAHACILGPHL